MLALGREAVILVLLLSAPPLLAALAVGLVAALLQATTQIQEQTLSAGPRIAAAFGALAVAGPWIGARLVRFAAACLEQAARGAP